MPTTEIAALEGPDQAVRVSFRQDALIYRGLTAIGRKLGYDTIDYMQKVLRDHVADNADPSVLPEEDKKDLRRVSDLIDIVIKIARRLVQDGKFTSDLTLMVFREAMDHPEFRRIYIEYIRSSDPYRHGNLRKGINKDLGWRIKNCIPADVMKNADGNPVKQNVTGEVIQSYTRLVLRDA